MILDFIINLITGILDIILKPIETMGMKAYSLSTSSIDLKPIKEYIDIAKYLLPYEYIKPLIIITLTLLTIKYLIAIIKTLWDLIPIA